MMLALNEPMILFKERSSIKKELPMKHVKCGFEVYMLADAITGYVSGFEVYTGKKGDKLETVLGSTVVKTVCHHIQFTLSYVFTC